MNLKECHKELGPVFLCDVQEECETGMPIGECANTMVQSGFIPIEQINAYKEDANALGYCDTSIEAHFIRLNLEKDLTIDIFASKENGKKTHFSKSWRKVIEEHGYTKPLPFEKEISGKYNLRASEKGCDLLRIISKLDKEKLNKEFGLKSDSFEAKSGVGRHALGNKQHTKDFVHNLRLRDIGVEPLPRWKYCEVELRYVTPDGITIKGSPDALSLFGNNYGIGPFDFKRRPNLFYPQADIVRQEMLYALATAQCLNLSPENFYGITIGRPFTKRAGVLRPPTYKIFSTPNEPEQPLIREIHAELRRSYEEQAKILFDKEHCLYVKEKMEHDNVCIRTIKNEPEPFTCFGKNISDYLVNRIREERKSLIEVLDDMKVMPQNWSPPQL